ncbi:MAG: hypothetical protein ACXVAM_18750 [Vulcanimicrobiaceae bacterium]
MHLLCVVMFYGIVWLISGSRPLAAGAALLFGLHPIANETVVVAIWTNATAYALLFSSFFLFLCSLRSQSAGGNWRIRLLASLSCALIALFTYEPTIVLFGLILGYLCVWILRGLSLSRSFLIVLFAGIAIELVFFFGVRHVMLTQAAPMNSLGIIVRNAVMYAVALLLPIDFVLANALFGTPLPSQLRFSAQLVALPVLAGAALLVLGIVLARSRSVKARLATLDGPVAIFFLLGIALGVLPLLLYRDHPSEHDLYLSVALYAGLLSMLAWHLARSKAVYGILVLLLAFSFASGTSVRNQRVATCARIAQRIVTQLPLAHWRKGNWHIQLATAPGQRLGQPYGIYNYSGVLTIQVERAPFPSAQEALQIATNNERLKVDVVSPRTIAKGCVKPATCFWISATGRVTEVPRATADRASQ